MRLLQCIFAEWGDFGGVCGGGDECVCECHYSPFSVRLVLVVFSVLDILHDLNFVVCSQLVSVAMAFRAGPNTDVSFITCGPITASRPRFISAYHHLIW